MKEPFAIAIDGPSGAGKSTLAKAVAAELGCVYLDTGAIYRTVAYHMILMGISPKDKDGVKRLIDDVNIKIDFPGDGKQHMLLNGHDVTDEIRTPEVSVGASQVSAYPVVRDVLLDLQRDTARHSSVVMDGRDIGTVVLPNADVKIFLTADVKVRAKRRLKELEQRGQRADYQTILAEIVQRDRQDSLRSAAPLKQAEDAVLLDTTHLDLTQTVDALLNIARGRIPM